MQQPARFWTVEDNRPEFGYDLIAAEYYDDGHITSRNFDQTTVAALTHSPPALPQEGLILELGAGRGRSREFLGVDPNRVVHLDKSLTMLSLPGREPCLLTVLADACDIPLGPEQFTVVTGFLVDPFLGLNCLREAHRMLRNGGELLFTTPTYMWGAPLRQRINLDIMTTRFRVLRSQKEEKVVLPSLLHTADQLKAMLVHAGFVDIEITDHKLPKGTDKISEDIKSVCKEIGVVSTNLPLIHIIRARRP